MTDAESQAPNTTSITIEDRIGMIMGNRITKMMDDTINMIKNVNSTVIVNQSENGITPVTNLTDVNKTDIRSTNELEKLAGNNIALTLDDSSTDIPNASMLEELEKSQTENATINEQDTTVFEGQNNSSTVNTTKNTSNIVDQKIINDNTGTNTTLYADNKTLATTTDKPTSNNNIGNFFTQIGESVKKFFGGN
jgi:CRISPR/Cas system CMR subunit Cmr4 (Cas7 group RAMP superfamily)